MIRPVAVALFSLSIAARNTILKQRTILFRSMATLETLNFDNQASRTLPLDQTAENHVRIVKGACYSRVHPTPVDNPKLVAFSKSALRLLDLTDNEVDRKEFVEYFSGNRLLPGSSPVAHCYCGHQFGYFAGQLGDGAAITLGEVVNKMNERWEIQIKGAGKTPYSRTADGRKVLRSSIREFLCSEALYFLGVPTTRAGCIITSDSQVVRDVYYDGNPILEMCSIVCRIAPTFIRFGSFQICKGPDRETGNSGPSASQPQVMKSLLDYVVETYYHDIWLKFNEDREKLYSEFFGEVVRRTAHLVAHWQCIGWCHGVLNTDNMSILGLTIDYGPFGFLDHYDPNHICNASDIGGRYSYKNQPEICKWNCEKLADVLQLFTNMSDLKVHLDTFHAEFKKKYLEIMRRKFGLLTEQDRDQALIDGFLDAMEKTGADFTNSFRCLSLLYLPRSDELQEGSDVTSSPASSDKYKVLKDALLQQCASTEEMKLYHKPQLDPSAMAELLSFLESNPSFRNLMGKQQHQIAIEIRKADQFRHWNELTEEGKKNNDSEIWKHWIESYVERLKLESDQLTSDIKKDEQAFDDLNKKRISIMNSTNPRFVLRNYIAQDAIDAAEKGDYSKIKEVLKRLEYPFEDDSGDNITSLNTGTPPGEVGMKVCHSPEKPPARSWQIKVT